MPCRGLELNRRWVLLLAPLFLAVLTLEDARATSRIWSADPDLQVQAGLAEGVSDPLFGFLLDLVDRDLFASIDTALLDSVATANGGSKLPVRLIRGVTREPSALPDAATVRFEFDGEVKTPIPYSILKYNPGSIRSSPVLEMLHFRLGDQHLELPGEDSDEVFELGDVELFVIRAGHMKMDIDGWLDKLLRGKLDDVELSGFLLFREQDRRVGLGFGYTGGRKGRTGAFDFTANAALFPAPKAYLALGRWARGLGERLLADPGAPRQLIETTAPR